MTIKNLAKQVVVALQANGRLDELTKANAEWRDFVNEAWDEVEAIVKELAEGVTLTGIKLASIADDSYCNEKFWVDMSDYYYHSNGEWACDMGDRLYLFLAFVMLEDCWILGTEISSHYIEEWEKGRPTSECENGIGYGAKPVA